MNAEVKRLGIKSAIYQMGLRFNQEPSKEKIEAYANDLMDYTPEQVTYAFRQVINSGSAFFPSISEILKHLRPAEQKKEDQAPMIANEIISFVKMHHFDLEHRYLDTLSPLAREVIQSLGSTQDIRDSENFEIMKAQLERSVKSVIAAKEYSSKVLQLNKIGIKFDGPMKKLSYEFSPEEPA
jgi:hypothetical protein